MADGVAADHPTWAAQVGVPDRAGLFARLVKAGLPLSELAGVARSCEIVALVVVRRGEGGAPVPSALVATPSGHVFRFEPAVVEVPWWRFAAGNYFVVTAGAADRVALAQLAGVDLDSIKGKVWGGRKAVGVPDLDAFIAQVAPPELDGQASLF